MTTVCAANDPKCVGEISEAAILVELLKSGETILTPFGDNQRYDLVLDRDGTFVRVQCKTGILRNGVIKFNTCSSSSHRTNGGNRDYRGQADLFAVYCHETDKVYLIPVDDAPRTGMSLRVEPTANNSKNVKWAKDYEFPRSVEKGATT
jgi:hypothetical protein